MGAALCDDQRAFRELSDVTLNDAVDSVCRLYAHYVDLLRSAGDAAADELSLDTFYGWADRILADFDDVDKNMADASQLFRNLEELKELDDMGFLDDEQKELIGSFFSNFDPDHKSEFARTLSPTVECPPAALSPPQCGAVGRRQGL